MKTPAAVKLPRHSLVYHLTSNIQLTCSEGARGLGVAVSLYPTPAEKGLRTSAPSRCLVHASLKRVWIRNLQSLFLSLKYLSRDVQNYRSAVRDRQREHGNRLARTPPVLRKFDHGCRRLSAKRIEQFSMKLARIPRGNLLFAAGHGCHY